MMKITVIWGKLHIIATLKIASVYCELSYHNRLWYTWSNQRDEWPKAKCDSAWENRAYVYTKFDHFFRLSSFITLWCNIAYQWNFGTSAANNGLFNIISIVCTEGEIIRRMWRCAFCLHKKIMKTITKLSCEKYINYEDDVSLQQISIVSHFGVAIPFRMHWQISIRRLQVLVA